MARRAFWITTAVASVTAGGFGLFLFLRNEAVLPPITSPGAGAPLVCAPQPPPAFAEEPLHAFRPPSGEPPELTCAAARTIVAQVRRGLAYAPLSVPSKEFASATADWLDPFGHWSAAPGAAPVATLKRIAPELISELEGRSTTDCRAVREVGRALLPWVADLRNSYDESFRAKPNDSLDELLRDPVFEGGAVTKPAKVLASLLGRSLGSFSSYLGESAAPFVSVARRRYFPEFDEERWGRIVLAAAVRAYVPLLDPHGAWAPLAEESSVYETDLEAHPPQRLWEQASRTPFGIRIDSGARPPLQDGDVVLAFGDILLAAMPFEQIEQLGFVVAEKEPAVVAAVIHSGGKTVEALALHKPKTLEARVNSLGAPDDELETERVGYGANDVLIVPIHDVRDDLGELLTHALLRARDKKDRPLAAIVLDLRGNGGGSTDGAIDALGLFLPGAPLFPMKRRDGSLETDRAPEPPFVDRWEGPVATLVDGETASAAEMIAGALASYHRGLIVGTTTFGKGCAQEYLDDEAQVGVLRLTTLLYALPDGSAVQRLGLTPHVRFPFVVAGAKEREALIPRSPPSWRGPDVRDPQMIARLDTAPLIASWPQHGGALGPCKDPAVCDALRTLGGHGQGKRAASRTK